MLTLMGIICTIVVARDLTTMYYLLWCMFVNIDRGLGRSKDDISRINKFSYGEFLDRASIDVESSKRRLEYIERYLGFKTITVDDIMKALMLLITKVRKKVIFTMFVIFPISLIYLSVSVGTEPTQKDIIILASPIFVLFTLLINNVIIPSMFYRYPTVILWYSVLINKFTKHIGIIFYYIPIIALTTFLAVKVVEFVFSFNLF